MHDFFTSSDDLASSDGIFEPKRKAEILRWFGREDIAIERKESLIQALIRFKDDCGDFFHYRAYFLAAEAIAYFPCTQANAIVRQLLQWSYGYFRQAKQDWKIYPQALTQAARATLEKTDRTQVIAQFVELLHTTESRSILRRAAERLGLFNPGNRSAIAALALLTQVPQAKTQLLAVLESLSKIDPTNPAIISTLVQLIQSTLTDQKD